MASPGAALGIWIPTSRSELKYMYDFLNYSQIYFSPNLDFPETIQISFSFT